MFYLIVIAIYLLFVALIVFFCHRRGMGWFGKLIIIVFLLLAPFWDMFLAKGIMWNYARKNTPLQEITRTIEKPESVLWIDNVWPGYDEFGRHWMVTNYLDGVHLKVLALNGADGRFYLYRASLSNFSESEKLLSKHEQLKKKIKQLENEAKQVGRSGVDNRGLWQIIRQDYYPQIKELGYETQRKREINQIFSRPEIYQKAEELPSMKYRVEFHRNRLSGWQEKFVWCDEIRIRDNGKGKDIAFSKRCLGYRPKLGWDPIGGTFSGGVRLGDFWSYAFDDKVLFVFSEKTDSGRSYLRNRINKR